MWLLCVRRRVIFPDPVILNLFAAVLLVFSFGTFLSLWLCSRFRHEDHRHQLAIQSGRPLDGADVFKFLGDSIELSSTDLGVRDLASAELADESDLVAVFQEPPSLLHVERDVVLSNSRTDLYTLYVLRFALPFFLALALFVLEVAVIDDLADRGLRMGGDQNQVEALFAGHIQSLSGLHDAQLRPIGADHSNVAEAQNALVGQGAGVPRRFSSKAGYRITSSFIGLLIQFLQNPCGLGSIADSRRFERL